MFLPESVDSLCEKLRKNGFQAYAVGGCVRDSLLGITPHDYDLCTDALPSQTAQIFDECSLVRSGEKHGTIGVVTDIGVVEITTFRTEGGYRDSRHPDWVKFVGCVRDDLARRDFTVNAIAYCPEQGYVDPFGGQQDLQNKLLRAVGNPQARFTEDPLRILRGVRFAVRFGLSIEPDTKEAMFSLSGEMDKLAKERIFDELCKLLPLLSAQDLLDYAPVLTAVIPELRASLGFVQHNHHHSYDVFTHTCYVTAAVPPVLALRWAALLHDVAKPETFYIGDDGEGHFPEHDLRGAQMADEILSRLKAPTCLRKQVVFLIKHHMLSMEPQTRLLRRRLAKYGEENVFALLCLQEADRSSKGTQTTLCDLHESRKLLEQILEEASCLSIKDLAINGQDLQALGFAAGPKIGQCLQYLLMQVLDERLVNEKEPLTQAAKDYFSKP